MTLVQSTWGVKTLLRIVQERKKGRKIRVVVRARVNTVLTRADKVA